MNDPNLKILSEKILSLLHMTRFFSRWRIRGTDSAVCATNRALLEVGQQLTTKSTTLTSFGKAMSKPCLARQKEFAQPRLIPLTLHSAGLRAFGERYVKLFC